MDSTNTKYDELLREAHKIVRDKYNEGKSIEIKGYKLSKSPDSDERIINFVLSEQNIEIANVGEILHMQVFDDLNLPQNEEDILVKAVLFDRFDKYKNLPKISETSIFMQDIFDQLWENEGVSYRMGLASQKDIIDFSHEVDKYNLGDIIVFDKEKFITATAELQTVFNDDRCLNMDKNLDNIEILI